MFLYRPFDLHTQLVSDHDHHRCRQIKAIHLIREKMPAMTNLSGAQIVPLVNLSVDVAGAVAEQIACFINFLAQS